MTLKSYEKKKWNKEEGEQLCERFKYTEVFYRR